MGDIVKMHQKGTPGMLFATALAEADEVEFALIVMVRKDKIIRTNWSTISSGATALGAIDILHRQLLKEL
jgi:hypothetical protein